MSNPELKMPEWCSWSVGTKRMLSGTKGTDKVLLGRLQILQVVDLAQVTVRGVLELNSRMQIVATMMYLICLTPIKK